MIPKTRITSYQKGLDAERRAMQHFHLLGLQTVARRYKCRWGEIDLIVANLHWIIFVEVKHRRHLSLAREAFDARAQNRMQHAAQQYLAEHPETVERDLRFDLIFSDDQGGFEHAKSAFEPEAW